MGPIFLLIFKFGVPWITKLKAQIQDIHFSGESFCVLFLFCFVLSCFVSFRVQGHVKLSSWTPFLEEEFFSLIFNEEETL